MSMSRAGTCETNGVENAVISHWLQYSTDGTPNDAMWRASGGWRSWSSSSKAASRVCGNQERGGGKIVRRGGRGQGTAVPSAVQCAKLMQCGARAHGGAPGAAAATRASRVCGKYGRRGAPGQRVA
eukprot:181636-Chlamydomonas_euryale.AAC.2